MLLHTPDANTDSTSSKESNETDEKAKSSTAENDDKQDKAPTLASVVKEAAEKTSESSADENEEEDDSSNGDVPESDTTKEDESKVDDEKEETVEDDKTKSDKKADEPPFHNHPRWKEVVGKNKELEETVEKSKPLVEQATTLNTFCQQNNVTSNQMTEALQFVALLNRDPKAAREHMAKLVETIDLTLGTRLPGDLAKKVEDGTMTDEDAKEVAKLRLKAAALERGQQTSTASTQQQQTQLMVNAMNQWDSARRSSDPDFKPKVNGDPDGKYEFVVNKIRELSSAKPPTSPEDAIKIAEQAIKDVDAALGRFRPQPRRTRNVNSTHSSTTARQTSEPQTLLEAVKLAAAGRG